jgi:hypothetical protein
MSGVDDDVDMPDGSDEQHVPCPVVELDTDDKRWLQKSPDCCISNSGGGVISGVDSLRSQCLCVKTGISKKAQYRCSLIRALSYVSGRVCQYAGVWRTCSA